MLLSRPPSSWKVPARSVGCDRHQVVEETACLIASEICNASREKFTAVVQHILALKDARLVAFVWRREYDETPTHCRTHAVAEDGAAVKETTSAKVMAASSAFAIVVELGGAVHTIHGELPSPLVNMLDATGPTTLKAIRRTMLPPLPASVATAVQERFGIVAVVRCSDLHRSNLAAERHEALTGTWRVPHVLFRCSVHRARTAERNTQRLDQQIESFLVNLGLSLRLPGVAHKMVLAAETWAVRRLAIYRGIVPEDVAMARRSLAHLAFADDDADIASVRRRAAFMDVLNGDSFHPRELQHYCRPGCCKNREETEAKVRRAMRELLNPLPPLFPRKSWGGQVPSASHTLLLMVMSILQDNWKPVHDIAKARREKIQHCLAHAEQQHDQQQQQLNEHGAPRDVDQADKLLLAALSREEAEKRCASVAACFERADIVHRLVEFRVMLGYFADVKNAMLKRGDAFVETGPPPTDPN